MENVLVWVLVIGGVVGGLWLFFRAKHKAGLAQPARAMSAAAAAAAGRRTGRMVHPTRDRCSAVRKLEGRWYAEGEVPALPLPDCEHPGECQCSWMEAFDRRVKHRRQQRDRRESIRMDDKPDRRSGIDRRADGREPWNNA